LNLSGCDGILCLTKKCESAYKVNSPRSKVKYIPWGVDTRLFFPNTKSSNEYFLAGGKTRRDYRTFLEACSKTSANFRIIAPDWSMENVQIPSNVTYLKTDPNIPDGTISYPDLRNWYTGCIATCIPLYGDPEDTSGYTNLLEAMGMGKPILMTRSGALDIDIEEQEIGFWIEPQDPDHWVSTIDYIRANPEISLAMGARAIKLATSFYNSNRFEKDVARFVGSL